MVKLSSKRDVIRSGISLAVICMAAAGFLVTVNLLAGPVIVGQAQGEEANSLKEVLPQAEAFEAVKSGGKIIYYKARNKQGELIGAVFEAEGKGYSGDIETMVGMLKDGTITAVKVLNQQETPGAGSRVAEAPFSSEFSNKNIQSLNDIQAITGATISSRAVIDSVKQKAEEVEALIRDANH